MNNDEQGECKVTKTLDTVTRLSYVVKRGLIRQRIFAATWSMVIFLALQFYIAGMMKMAGNSLLIFGVCGAYLVWVGYARYQLHQLDKEYNTKLDSLPKSI